MRAVGLGLLLLRAAVAPAGAGEITRSGMAAVRAAGVAPSSASATGAAASPGVANAQAMLARSANVLTAVRAMQVAARNVAMTGPNHLLTPAGQALPDVPDGLAAPTNSSLDPGPGLRIDIDANGNPVLWTGANLPTASGNQVTVTQTQQQALLQWRSFDIGKHTTLNFDQSAGADNVGQWIAFNKINDPSGRPSQILGAINTLGPGGAPGSGGQVYVINQNGIIFGGSSQVNTHALVASSLPINDNLVNAGLLNNPDSQFLFTAVQQAAGAVTPIFTPPSQPAGGIGDVVVQPGAQLNAPATADNEGGLVALVGPNVSNQGAISTPDGQTILAAGLEVAFAPHAQADPTLRGLDVYVGEVSDLAVKTVASTTGTAANDIAADGTMGWVEAPHGNVTLMGQAVDQFGVIDSSTSVSLNGRIDLLAEFGALNNSAAVSANSSVASTPPFLFQSTGLVTLGGGSATQVLPDLTSPDRVVGTQLALPSLVNVLGSSIHLSDASPVTGKQDAGNGAIILAPGASTAPLSGSAFMAGSFQQPLAAGVMLNAGEWFSSGVSGGQLNKTSTAEFANTSGQIYLDPGTGIDVAGSEDVPASVAENIVSVQLLGTELANSPLQRNGPLRGQSIQVDVRQIGQYNGQWWAGTPLADTTGYINLIQRTAGELTTNGGTVALNAGSSVVMQPGSSVNVSGGWTDYQGSMVQTTQVMANGHIMDISKATPNLVYQGIYNATTTITDPKWGVTETFTSPVSMGGAHYEQGYIQGGNGGSISITAPAVALDGGMFGDTVAGPYQRTPSSQVAKEFGATAIGPTMESILAAPASGALALTFHGQLEDPSTDAISTISPTPPAVIFGSGAGQSTVPAFATDGAGNPLPLPADRQGSVFLSPDLVDADGLGGLKIINEDGDVSVPANVSLNAPAGGDIEFTAANITLDGSIRAPGGTLAFTVEDISPFSPPADVPGLSIPMADPGRGQFILGPSQSLNTAGLVVDDQSASDAGLQPLFTDGGSISIAAYRTTLSTGSVLDVSGGVARSAAGKLSYGAGGSLTVKGGQDPGSSGVGQVPGANNAFLGDLNMDLSAVTLLGYSGKAGAGGKLNLLAPLIQIGGSQLLTGDARTLWLNPTDVQGNPVGPDFFSQGGFGTFNLTGLGGAAKDASGAVIPDQFVPAVTVAPAAVIDPQVGSWMALTPADGSLVLTPTLLPIGQRSPVNFSLTAKGVSGAELVDHKPENIRGDVIIGAGATIQTDPQTIDSTHGVALTGDTVTVLGRISAPGGTIAITGGTTTATVFPDGSAAALPTVDLGPGSTLSAAGAAVLTPDPSGRGLLTGLVLPGGKITIDGNIVAEAGAALDVSGASGQFDVLSSYTGTGATPGAATGGNQYVRVEEDGNGGSIKLQGEEELFSEATLSGFAGGPSAMGGSLFVSGFGSGTATPQEATLILSQSDQNLPIPSHPAGQTAIGNPVLDSHGNAISSAGYIAANSINNGAFASVTLDGSVQYSGTVALTATQSLTVGTGGVVLADPSVANSSLTLRAPYVALGTAPLPPLQAGDPAGIVFKGILAAPFAPTYGTGSLSVDAADLIDIGNLSLQNIGSASFNVPAGDIRGDGTLDAAGELALDAGQIYVPTAASFNIAVYTDTADGQTAPGSVAITNSNSIARQMPLSAGGTLNIFASTINQDGVLRAPLGRINLGWDGTGTAPWTDPIAGSLLPLPVARTLILAPGSTTSISAIDPTTGQALTVPYGINLNGTQWVDPTGTDITLTGVQFAGSEGAQINLSALDLDDQAGSSIEIRGGGDLYAYQWVSGTGGTMDVLNTSNSFAIIPGYQAAYAPFTPYNLNTSSTAATNLLAGNPDQGYVNSNLHVGDQIYLNGGGGLLAGTYTLLPARYALLPGAYLVTPQSGAPASSLAKPDGSVLVSGYRSNALAPFAGEPLLSAFELASGSVVRQRAQYDDFSANTYISQKAQGQNLAVPPLPVDSGQLVLTALNQMTIEGKVASAPLSSAGRGGTVDIDSPGDIWILGPNAAPPPVDPTASNLILNSADLSAFGAESLLIGGVRAFSSAGTTVTVAADNLTVDNAGVPLAGPEITLVAKNGLTLAPGADVEQQGNLSSPAQTLLPRAPVQIDPNATVTFARGGAVINFPDGIPNNDTISASVDGTLTANGVTSAYTANTSISPAAGSTLTLNNAQATLTAGGSGAAISISDGVLLRVSSDASAQIARTGAAGASTLTPTLTVGAAARISGASVTLDSTASTTLDPSATLSAQTLALDSGQISLQLPSNPGLLQPTTGLVLSSSALQKLQAASLSLLSYSSIDLYGTGAIEATGNLALHAGEIRGFSGGGGGDVTFSAQGILLDNSANAAGPGPLEPPSGTLAFEAGTIQLGANDLAIDQYANVALNASNGILLQGTGGLTAQRNLTLATPMLTGATAARQTVTASQGNLTVENTAGTAIASDGLGASLTLAGASVTADTAIVLPSGTLILHATGAASDDDVVIGPAGSLDVSGTAQSFFDSTQYTDGGQISLISDNGSVVLNGTASVSAQAGGGNAGSLSVVTAPSASGVFANNGTLLGQGGGGGRFLLDAGSIPGGSTASLTSSLFAGGFTQSISIRDRTDPSVTIDGTATAHTFNLSSDEGNITVMGKIDASGLLDGSINPSNPTGGVIDLAAAGDITLDPAAILTAAGYCYDDSGKGGSISLAAGSYTGNAATFNQNAFVSIDPAAKIDLGVANQFTTEDLALHSDLVAHPELASSYDNRTDLAPHGGTLLISEPQTAFGNGAQFTALGQSVAGASSIVLDGVQIFDLANTDGLVSTPGSGSVTKIGSSGLIDSVVEQAISANGSAFVNHVNSGSPGLFDPASLFHVEPGAEVVNGNTSTATSFNLYTLYASGTSTGSSIKIAVPANKSVTVLVPGGIFTGDSLSLSGLSTTFKATVNTVDPTKLGGSAPVNPLSSGTNLTSTTTLGSSGLIQSITFTNSTASSKTATLLFSAGSVPIAVAVPTAVPAGTTVTTAGTLKPTQIATTPNNLTLANTWDLSSPGDRFGPKNDPGILTLRTAGSLVFNFDASLNDGFDPTNAASSSFPLWSAQLQSGRSWSYNLVAGADLTAANLQAVQPGTDLAAGTGSLLLGLGAPALPTVAATARSAIIPEYFQVIRTGTGDIDVSAGQDIELLDSLATIYTAGTQAAALTGFDIPLNSTASTATPKVQTPFYPAQYSQDGGNVTLTAQHDIVHELVNTSTMLATPDSSTELPTSWLYRRGYVNPATGKFDLTHTANGNAEIASTTWWIDFSNFFEGVGALGGGNVTLRAGHDVKNVDAVVPTSARMPGRDESGNPVAPNAASLVELGGGNLTVQAGDDIDGGVYYVERGAGALSAGNEILTNSTRAAVAISLSTGQRLANADPSTWLPTTLFLGQGSFDITAGGDLLLGPVANPFLLPQGVNNTYFDKTYFSTYATSDAIDVASLTGDVTLKDNPDTNDSGSLIDWYNNLFVLNDPESNSTKTLANRQPWLATVETTVLPSASTYFKTAAALMPPALHATAFSGDLNVVGSLTLSPSPVGTVDLVAEGSINGTQPSGLLDPFSPPSAGNPFEWGSSAINLSDANPNNLPGITNPLSLTAATTGNAATQASKWTPSPVNLLSGFSAFFNESGSSTGSYATLQVQQALHADLPINPADPNSPLGPLHYNDPNPVQFYAATGNISGVTLFAGKKTQAVAGQDLTDVAFYIQNNQSDDVSIVSAGRDLLAYDPNSPLRLDAGAPGNQFIPGATQPGPGRGTPTAGDIQISGPGTLEVLAGRNFDLGAGASNPDGTSVGLTSIGNARNPSLPFAGASITAGAGLGRAAAGLSSSPLVFTGFIAGFLNPVSGGTEAARYLPDLGVLLGLAGGSNPQIWDAFNRMLANHEEQAESLALDIFYLVLRDAGRDFHDPSSPGFNNYGAGFAAIAALFPGNAWQGDLSLSSRNLETENGGDISLFAPGGGLTLGFQVAGAGEVPPGIVTAHGGNISIFTRNSVDIGVQRIFTLRGGNEIIWSSTGNIAAGRSSKTVQTAPPTEVLIDPQSANVQTDLAGLATGGGIGVLASVAGVPVGNVDLIAPGGFVDAGDAGIRATGNLNIAAVQVLNSSNIQAGGTTTGAPAAVSAPSLGSLASVGNTTAAATNAADQAARDQARGQAQSQQDILPSIITVEVLGYGGGEGSDDGSQGN